MEEAYVQAELNRQPDDWSWRFCLISHPRMLAVPTAHTADPFFCFQLECWFRVVSFILLKMRLALADPTPRGLHLSSALSRSHQLRGAKYWREDSRVGLLLAVFVFAFVLRQLQHSFHWWGMIPIVSG